jgi:hypothetical protein
MQTCLFPVHSNINVCQKYLFIICNKIKIKFEMVIYFEVSLNRSQRYCMHDDVDGSSSLYLIQIANIFPTYFLHFPRISCIYSPYFHHMSYSLLGLIKIIISLPFSRKKYPRRLSYFAKKWCDYRGNRFAKN